MAPLPFFKRRSARQGNGNAHDVAPTGVGGKKGGEHGGQDVLDRAPLFSVLEPELRQSLRKRLVRRRVRSGKPLFSSGEPADTLYVLESGRLRLFVSDRPGHERVLRFIGPGEVVGEAAFIGEATYVTDAVAVEDVSVWSLSRADFDALLGMHGTALRYLAGVVAQRQAQANARLASEVQSEGSRALSGFVAAVYSPRGGAGVTTIAVNLGITLAQGHPDDVVLLDLDRFFGHALSSVWLEPRGTLAQVSPVTLRELDRAGLEIYLVTHASSLRLLPAAATPEEGQTITAEHVRSILSAARRHFGFVVLDLPHTFDEVALTALESADRILIVGTPEATTMRHMRETERILTGVLRIPLARLRYVLNHPLPYGGVSASDFAAATAAPWTEIGHGDDAPSVAALRGESLVDTRRANAVVRGVASLAEQITRDAEEHAALAGRSSQVGR